MSPGARGWGFSINEGVKCWNPMSDILTVDDAATMLKVSPDTVRDWARRGTIPAAKIGKEWRFVTQQLHEFIEDKARQNVRERVLLVAGERAQVRLISGVDSRSVAERFARAPAPRTGRKPRSTGQ